MTEVVVVANDIVPGLGLPVAAPGLRAHGLASGLRANSIDTIVTVPRSLVEREWSKRSASMSWPTNSSTVVVPDSELAAFLEARHPPVVILTNSNKFDAVERYDRTRYVFDFFAPKVKELEASGPIMEQQLADLRKRKLRALDRADAVIVNGAKKVPYVLEWLAQSRDGIRGRSVEVVNMPIEPCFSPPIEDSCVNVAMAGYLVPWIRFGESLNALRAVLDETPGLTLHLWMPEHWGAPQPPHPDSEGLSRLRKHPSTHSRHGMLFEDYQYYLSRMDLFIDLFSWSAEREMAMVTRTVTAIACGVPVVHPTFTECSPLIEKYQAGWLVDSNREDLASLLKSIVSDRLALSVKRAGARSLARAVFSPKIATRPLAELIRSLP